MSGKRARIARTEGSASRTGEGKPAERIPTAKARGGIDLNVYRQWMEAIGQPDSGRKKRPLPKALIASLALTRTNTYRAIRGYTVSPALSALILNREPKKPMLRSVGSKASHDGVDILLQAARMADEASRMAEEVSPDVHTVLNAGFGTLDGAQGLARSFGSAWSSHNPRFCGRHVRTIQRTGRMCGTTKGASCTHTWRLGP